MVTHVYDGTRSAWMDVATPIYASLDEDVAADVCIVGAGVAGMTTAYALAAEGMAVVVLDDGPVGGGMTRRTTAHLSNAIDDRYVRIERLHGRDGARIAAQSHTAAIDRIESIVQEERIDCDFERLDGYLVAARGTPADFLGRELAAAQRAGLTDVTVAARAPSAGFEMGRCLRFPRQGQLHPGKYLAGLARALERRGARIFCGSHVTAVQGGTAALVTTTTGHTVSAAAAVVATNTPINDVVTIHTKQAAYSTYVVAARVPRGSVVKALYWDTADPYHYVRLHEDGVDELLIVGGEDHKSGQAHDGNERFARLEQWMHERFPTVRAVTLRWSGQVMEPMDGVAFIGRNPGDESNVYIATGDSGMGMTHGTIAGMLLTDLIAGRPTPWAALYDPARKMLRAPIEYAKENLNVAAQYFDDYLRRGDVDSADEIAPGRGAVLRHGLTKIAAYRDHDGTLHEYSAVCPHLGCIVQFDDVEKTWDCPCHGSRFDRFGHVIVGPANRDLAPSPHAEPEPRRRVK
ncbi:MAG TPA: FAD-dependent oxidoreductase [Rhodanobacteraceae bacterium]|nr:FAD-dependent oxidoreductase [Rhodanobacteraceae bacterium]